MALFHLLLAARFDFSVLHVNYQLRGKDSDADETLVEEVCKKNGVQFYVRKIKTKQILAEKGGNLQDFARKTRYSWFKEILSENEDNCIVLGHHQDDQIETFFQHIARKSGIIGMAGMLENHKGIIRPLLKYSKEAIYAFARENKIEWREDLSNDGNAYTRNKLRNIIIPELEKEIPTLKESVLVMVQAFQQTQKEIESRVHDQIEKIKKSGNWLFADFDPCTDEEKAEILRSIGVRQTFVLELNKIRSSQKGKRLFTDDFEIIREADSIYFTRQKTDQPVFHLRVEEINELPQTFDKNSIYLDADKIEGDLQLRKWRTGDRMKPIGMDGSKLISDILTASKLPTNERNEALLLVDDKKILWCVGIKISSLAIATPETSVILKASVDR